MAIPPSRLPSILRWRRGPDAPIDEASPVVEPSRVPDDTPARMAPGAPERGPDGRFVRRSATLAAAPDRVADAPFRAPGRREGPDDHVLVAGHPGEATLLSDDLSPVFDRAGQPLRIVLVEDVPEVVEHVREMLRSQSRFNLVHVTPDGGRAVEEIGELEPDVVLVDALLQGRTSGPKVVERLRSTGSPVGIVALSVPDRPLDGAMSRQADAVVALPFRTFDLARGIVDAHAASTARNPSSGSRIVAVFSPKGGVGKTTIAYNLAASLAATGLRTLLLDGCLQFGDVRRLLGADPAAPSICDLPTHSVHGRDLAEVVLHHGSAVDVLLAPSRPELADLVTDRDLNQLIDVLRRAYQAIVIDTPSTLREPTLVFLDAADIVIDVLTPDPATVDVTRMIAATFAEIGYPTGKVRYLVNRHDAVGSLSAEEVKRALGWEPEYLVACDREVVSASNRQRVPFVLARSDAPASVDIRRLAEGVRRLAVLPVATAPAGRRIWGH